jgi:hypothetical protein
MPAFDPVRKNRSSPLCRKLLIIRIVYMNAIRRASSTMRAEYAKPSAARDTPAPFVERHLLHPTIRRLFDESEYSGSGGVVKNDAYCVTMPRAQPAYAMPQIHAIRAACAVHWPVMHGEDHGIALA